MSKPIDKTKLLDVRGRPLTQGLFLEHDYNTDYAVYTLKPYDFEYEGKLYPSLKRLYLEEEDVIEYGFANKHLYDWDTWQKICSNGKFKAEVEKWRMELELKLRSDAVKTVCDSAFAEQNFQAAKWLATGEWKPKQAGRPNKQEQRREEAIRNKISSEYEEDIKRAAELGVH